MGFLVGARASSKMNDKQTVTKVIDLLNNGFSLFDINRQLTQIPEVQIAINSIAETVSIVPFSHVRVEAKQNNTLKIDYQNSKINNVLSIRTNPFQCPQSFFTNIISRLLYNNNVFCLPEWDYTNGNLKWIYPLPFTQFEFKELNGETWVIFSQGGTAFLYSDLIHLKRFPLEKYGMKEQSITNYTQVVTAIQQAAIKQLEASGKIKALLIAQNDLKDKDMKKKLDEFKANFLNSENVTGLGMITGQYEVKQIDINTQNLDTALFKELISFIYCYYGTSLKIINKEALELEYQQFVNSLVPLLKQIVQELTFKLFSDDEIYKGNRIIYDELELEIATLQAKTLFLDKLAYQGYMTRNEGRRRIGLSWVEGGDELLSNKNAANIKEVNANSE